MRIFASKDLLVAACCVALKGINQGRHFSEFELDQYPSLARHRLAIFRWFEVQSFQTFIIDVDHHLLFQDCDYNRDKLEAIINNEESQVVQTILDELGISKSELFLQRVDAC